MRKIIERIKAKSSKKNRVKGQVKTTLGLVCVAVLSAGVIVNPVGIVLLTVGSVVFGASATTHALKTNEDV